MSDLISRQAAIDSLKVAYWDENIQSARDDPCIVDAMTDWAIRKIKGLPTIDAVPVKHGEWIHGREVSRDYVGDACVCIHYEKWWCSECNYTVDLGKPLWHYCPVCGAKMDGGKDDE